MIEGLIRREFNRWAAQGRGRGMEKTHWDITRQLIDLMNVQPDDDVADLGCGVGWATRVLAEKASRGIVVGIDLSDVMIQQAIQEYRNPPNAIFVLADAAHIPCPDKMFNALLSVESIYYYPDLERAFQEVHRILKPSGKAHFLINYYKENVYSHEWSKYIDIPLQWLAGDEYCKLLTTAGFAIATHRRIVDTTPIPEDWKPSRWFPTLQAQVNFQAEGALLLSAEK
jgi:SAM-dependent methyltransferase